MKQLPFLLLFLFFLGALHAQVDLVPVVEKPTESAINGQKVSFTRLLREMEKARGWTVFRDLEIVFNHSEDKFDGMDEWYLKKNKKLHFTASHIGIYNCRFDEEYWLVLDGAEFDGHLSFVGCTNVKAIFDNCLFHESLRFHSNVFEFAQFNNCRFELGFRFTRGQVTDNLSFKKCEFDYNTRLIGIGGGFDMDDRLFYISNKIDGIDVTIDSCVFRKNSHLKTTHAFVDLSESQFKNLILQNSEFEPAINFERSVVNGYLDLSNNRILGGIMPNGMTYNFNNSTIIWDDLKNNAISIYDKNRDLVLNKTNVNDPYDSKKYNKIISSYTAIFNAYKSQGNKGWANDCYHQWKEIETEGYLKKGNFTDYTLNRFLDIFCDFGTNPVKAAKYSILVIFLFSILYLFIPFEENDPGSHVRRAQLIRKIKDSRGGYAELYRRESAGFVHKSGIRRNRNLTALKAAIFHQVERLGKSRFNRRFEGAPLSAAFFLMGASNTTHYYLAKLFHSIILSMNAFVTLGFGSMKVKGDYIYLSILEGICGWFLLSIFTVSLINQIINW